MGTHILSNERLTIRFTTDYKGTRFDHVGSIQSVTLDDKDTFYSTESLNPRVSLSGVGFYNEFGIEEPIGYDEITPGEKFLKIGVGTLTKVSDDAYDFLYPYPAEFITPTCSTDSNRMIFTVEHPNHIPYAVHYKKEITLLDNTMTISYTLKNTGEKPIRTTEYCHNFVAINGAPIGKDYTLDYSFPVQLKKKVGDFLVQGNQITFDKDLEGVMYCQFSDVPVTPNQYVTLKHVPSGVGFTEHSPFSIKRIAVWGMSHVISPESFIDISLEPNEEMQWQRVYTFFN